MSTIPNSAEADRSMERASTVDNPASHCILIHRRDGYDLRPVNTVKRWAPDVSVTVRGPTPAAGTT